MKFANKVVLITGATSGIGRQTALLFAREGASVVVSGRRELLGMELVEQIVGQGGHASFIGCDVSVPEQVEALVNGTLELYGRLDCAFNNAGIEGDMGPTVEADIENYQRVFDINVRGVLLSMKFQIQAMLKTGGGTIVNNSSVAGLVAMPGIGVYAASKHAVLGLTKAAALEVASSGVRINAVCPAAIETDMLERFTGGEEAFKSGLIDLHPIGRIGQAQEVAEAVLWLCSNESSFIVGHALPVDGGFLAR